MNSPIENRQLVEHAFDALAQADSRPLVDLLDDEVVWTLTGYFELVARLSGKQAVLGELLRELAVRLADRYRATAERILTDGDFVVVQARGQAVTLNGSRYDNQYCFIFRMDSGKIREVTEYQDTLLASTVLSDPTAATEES